MTTLDDFGAADPLIVEELRPIVSPIDDKILGFAGPTNRGGTACVCESYRYNDPQHRQHYYRKIEGYTFADPDLFRFRSEDVAWIIIEEVDNGRVLEFSVGQFEQGLDGGRTTGHRRRGVPVADAFHAWKREECTIVKANPDRRHRQRR